MNAATAYMDIDTGYSPSFNDTGVSKEALSLKETFKVLVQYREESVYLKRSFSLPEEIVSELSNIENDCALDNWDGEGAREVLKITISKAKELLHSLPKFLQSPEIEAEVNGSISFEWYKTPKRIFVVRINELGELKYAGLFGPVERHRGTSYFDGYVPKDIIQMIKRIYA
jgi:hypothetical protein